MHTIFVRKYVWASKQVMGNFRLLNGHTPHPTPGHSTPDEKLLTSHLGFCCNLRVLTFEGHRMAVWSWRGISSKKHQAWKFFDKCRSSHEKAWRIWIPNQGRHQFVCDSSCESKRPSTVSTSKIWWRPGTEDNYGQVLPKFCLQDGKTPVSFNVFDQLSPLDTSCRFLRNIFN